MNWQETLGERLMVLQRHRKVRNRDLARAAGVAEGTVSHWRHDHQTPTDEALARIAPLLGVNVEYLRYGAAPVHAVREVPQRLTPSVYQQIHAYLGILEVVGASPRAVAAATRMLELIGLGALHSDPREIALDLAAVWHAISRRIAQTESLEIPPGGISGDPDSEELPPNAQDAS